MKSFFYVTFLFAVSISCSMAVELEGGIFNDGSKLQIKMRPADGSFNFEITAAQFAIKYLSTYGVTFGTPVNPTGISFSYQETKTSGSYTYRFYSWGGAYTPNWTENSEYLVMEVTVSGGTGLGNFLLINGDPLISGSDPNWYVESPAGLTGGTSIELYQPNVLSIPIPVELTSFNAKPKGISVELNWQTASELNNLGFDIERALVNSKSKISDHLFLKIGFVEGKGSHSTANYSFTDENPNGGSKFIYRLKQIDYDGTFSYSDEVEVKLLPDKFEIFQNYPNPFNPVTNIKFSLPYNSKVRLDVYNILGELVETLIDAEMEPGFYNIPFNAVNLSTGTYIYRFQTKGFSQTKKMLLIK